MYPKVTAALAAILALTVASIAAAATVPHWSQRPSAVLVATRAWEAEAVSEPSVFYNGRLFQMWYSGGGYGPCAMGYAVSRDGVVWSKQTTHPVLGGGYGGDLGNACHSNVQKLDGRYYAWYSLDGLPGVTDHDLHVATSPDGLHWQARAQPAIRAGGWATTLANSFVVRAGNHWLMIWEALSTPALWRMGTATSTDLIHWTVAPAMPQVDVGFDGDTAGGPWVVRERDGTWTMYLHARNYPLAPTFFSLLYTATSTDLRTWKLNPVPLLAPTESWETDQMADPSIVTAAGHRLMYFDGLYNGYPLRASIGLAVLG